MRSRPLGEDKSMTRHDEYVQRTKSDNALERIADGTTNIAERVIYLVTGSLSGIHGGRH